MISVDPNNVEEMKRAKELNQRMVQRAIDMEGTCTGEHGVGVGKRDYLDHELGQTTVDTMRRLKKALDPHGLMNPGKVFRLNKEGEEGEGGKVEGVKEGTKLDAHDERPDHRALPNPTQYVAAPAGQYTRCKTMDAGTVQCCSH
jgi:hypothetical protein